MFHYIVQEGAAPGACVTESAVKAVLDSADLNTRPWTNDAFTFPVWALTSQGCGTARDTVLDIVQCVERAVSGWTHPPRVCAATSTCKDASGRTQWSPYTEVAFVFTAAKGPSTALTNTAACVPDRSLSTLKTVLSQPGDSNTTPTQGRLESLFVGVTKTAQIVVADTPEHIVAAQVPRLQLAAALAGGNVRSTTALQQLAQDTRQLQFVRPLTCHGGGAGGVTTSQRTPMHTLLTEEQVAQFYAEGFIKVSGVYAAHEVSRLSEIADNILTTAKSTDVVADPHAAASGEHQATIRGTQFVVKLTHTAAPGAAETETETEGATATGHSDATPTPTPTPTSDTSTRVSLMRAVGCQSFEPSLQPLLMKDATVHTVAHLLKTTTFENMIMQFHAKEPGDGVSFVAHRDIQYRLGFDALWHDVTPERLGSYAVGIVAVDPMTEENGGLYVVRGSHKDYDFSAVVPADDNKLDTEQLKSHPDAVPICLSPGDVAFMHPYLLHWSPENTSHTARRSFVLGNCSTYANHKPYPGHLSNCVYRVEGVEAVEGAQVAYTVSPSGMTHFT
eukprot:GFYU01012243.1.p1 GENE.GFYU01012243.1~~GFYU01012243.1.p1  ORF type:complete len:561 (-),score=133.46 GFYU01012243.1:169-1851(-)